MVSFQSEPSGRSRPVMPALVASVTCRAPSDRVHATQVSTVPKHRSRRARDRPCRAAWPAWWPTRWAPPGCHGRAGQGTCPRCAGPASRGPGPPARRWRGPTPPSIPAGWRCPRPPPARLRPGRPGPPPRRRPPWRRRRTPRTPGRARRAAPRCGARGGWSRRGRRPRRAPPTCPRRRRGCSWPAHLAEGRGQAQLAGIEHTARVEAVLEVDEDVEAPPSASAMNRPRLRPMPWWWLMDPP